MAKHLVNRALLALLLSVALLGAACGSDDGGTDDATTTTADDPAAGDSTGAAGDDAAASCVLCDHAGSELGGSFTFSRDDGTTFDADMRLVVGPPLEGEAAEQAALLLDPGTGAAHELRLAAQYRGLQAGLLYQGDLNCSITLVGPDGRWIAFSVNDHTAVFSELLEEYFEEAGLGDACTAAAYWELYTRGLLEVVDGELRVTADNASGNLPVPEEVRSQLVGSIEGFFDLMADFDVTSFGEHLGVTGHFLIPED